MEKGIKEKGKSNLNDFSPFPLPFSLYKGESC